MDIKFNAEIFRKDYPIIFAKNRHLASIGSVRLAYDAAGYVVGQVLGRFSSGAKSGLFGSYVDSTGPSGTDTAACVLLDACPVGDFVDTNDTQMRRGIFKGELRYANLTGIDAAGVTDLKGRTYIEADGVTVLSF